MKIAEISCYKYKNERREMYSIWLRMHDGEIEQFHGSIINYRARGWEKHVINLIIDSIRITLTLMGYEVVGSVQ